MDDHDDVAILLDRFVSASAAEDVASSLEALIESLSEPTQVEAVLGAVQEDDDLAKALLEVLQTSELKQMQIEDGSSLAARIYLRLLEKSTTNAASRVLLQHPTPGRLVEALIDVAASDESSDGLPLPAYPRVLSLQCLRQLATRHASTLRQQLLEAPNGLHRLGSDLLLTGDEQVRNEALLLAGVLAEWPAVARNWMFNDVGNVVVQLAEQEGGLTSGNVLVEDCLRLLYNIVKHDASFADLLLESAVVLPSLTRLLDLRGGRNFLHPPKQQQPAVSNVVEKDDEDDLDDLLLSGAATSQKKKTPAEPERVVPRLLPGEEAILQAVLDVLSVVMENDSARRQIWRTQTPLMSLVWEMALLTPPPPSIPYPCAVPSTTLQQRALQVTAKYFYDPATMERLGGLDRLLYIVCTGGGDGKSLDERTKLSQSALHVIRQTLSKESAQEMLMHTLAPPMQDESVDGGAKSSEPVVTVVQKLLNTVFENLVPPSEEILKDKAAKERRKVFLLGATSALALFATDEVSRSILLRLTSSAQPTLIDAILTALSDNDDEDDDFIVVVLLRFVAQWMSGAPVVVEALLSSSLSTVLPTLYASSKLKTAALTSLVLGLAMTNMGSEETDENKCGGWTVASVMEMIATRGVSKYTSKLEKFKSFDDLPWSVCELEWNLWIEWYNESVLVIRKRVVQELSNTRDGDGAEEASDGEEPATDSSARRGSVRALKRLVSQQTDEMEELRKALADAKRTIDSKGTSATPPLCIWDSPWLMRLAEKQLSVWKLRVESTPTQLDEMLSEYTTKNAELDAQIVSLNDEMRAKEERHDADLKARDEQIDSLQQQVQEAMGSAEEARQDRDSMRDELAALSEAYSHLEEEYRQLSGQSSGLSASAAAGASSAEQGEPVVPSEREQPEGEASQQFPSGSTEVAALKADNARLRLDARAADEWMSMAVERMNAFGAENASLHQEIASLRAQLETLGSSTSLGADQRAQLESQWTQALQATEHALAEEEHRRSELEAKLAQMQLDTKSMSTESAKVEELEKQLEQNRVEMQMVLESLSEADVVRKELERSSDALRKDLEEARGELAAVRRSEGESSESDVAQLSNDSERLLAELKAAKDQLETGRIREQEEIYRREARIRELEARLDGGLGEYTIDDIRRRDEDIEQLQEANNAAQEWMNKAVEHHQLLSNQVSSLTHEKSTLSAQVKELTARLTSIGPGVADSRHQQLEQDLASCVSQVDELRSSLAQRDELIERLRAENDAQRRAELDRLAQLEEQLALKQSAIEEMQAAGGETHHSHGPSASDVDLELKELETRLAEQEQEATAVINQWKESYDVLQDSKIQMENQLQSLQQQLGDRDGEIVNSVDLSERVSELEQNLAEAMARSVEWREKCEAAERRLSELEQIAERANESEARLSKTESVVESLRQELSDQAEEANQVISQWQASYATVEAVKVELEGRLSELEARYGQSSEEDRPDQAMVRLSELESQVTRLEQELLEAQGCYSAVEAEKNDLASQVTDLMQRLDANTDGYGGDSTSDVALEVSELQSQISSLKTQLSEQEVEANQVIEQWQESYAAVEAQKNELELSIAGRGEENATSAANAAADSAEDVMLRVSELEATIESLEGQLHEQEEEASKAIAMWQESYTAVERQKAELESRVGERESQLALSADSPNNGLTLEEVETSDLRFQARIDALQAELSAKEEKIMELVSEWEVRLATLDAENERLQGRIDELEAERDALVDERSVGDPSLGESELQALRKQLSEQEQEANQVIAQWQESYAAVEAQRDDLERRVADLEAKRGESSESSDQTKPADHVSGRIAELEWQVDSLNQQLMEQEEETNRSAARQQDQLNAVELEKNDLKARVVELEQLAVASDDTPVGEQVPELLEQVARLEHKLVEQQEEASAVISQWQESCAAMEAQKNELEAAIEANTERGPNENTPQSEDKQSAFTELEHEVGVLREEMEAQKADFMAEIAGLQAKLASIIDERDQLLESHASGDLYQRCESLESELASLRGQLSEATDVVSQWEQSYAAVAAERDELRANIVELEQATAQSRIEPASTVESDGADTNLVVTDLENEVKELRELLDAERREAGDAIAQWEESYAEGEALRAELEARVHELEQESRGAVADNIGETTSVRELETQLAHLQQQLESRESESNAIIAQWKRNHSDVVQVKEDLEKRVVELIDDLSTLEAKVAGLSSLESELKTLQDEFESERNEATETIAKWEESYNTLQTAKEEVEVLLAGTRDSDLARLRKEHEESLAVLERRCMKAETEVSELATQLESMQREISSRDATISALQSRIHSTQQEASSVEARLAQSTSEMERLQTEIESEHQRSNELASSLEASENAGVELRDALQQAQEELKEKHTVLESQRASLAAMDEQAAHSRQEAEAVIGEWEAGYRAMEARLAELEESMQATKKEREDLLVQLRVADWKIVSEKVANDALLSKYDGLLSKYEESEARLFHKGDSLRRERDSLFEEIGSLRSQVQALEEDRVRTQEEASELQNELESFTRESEETINQWKERVEELESTVEQLETELQEQHEEADQVIAMWEARCRELESSAPIDGSGGGDSVAPKLLALLRTELKSKRKLVASCGVVADTGDDAGVEAGADLDAVDQLESELNRYNNLLGETLADLKSRLGSLTNDNNQLQQSVQSLNTTVDALQAASGANAKNNAELQAMSRSLESDLAAANEQKAALEAELQQAKERLSEAAVSAEQSNASDELVDQVQTLTSEKVFLQEEKERLQALVRDLRDELREANDAIQLHFTNEVSDRATEMAAAALRHHVDDMRSQLEKDRDALHEEQHARQLAEEEVARLRADLAAILGVEDTAADAETEIRRQAILAREEFQRQERKEIEELEDILTRALDELAEARAGEAEAQEQLSNASLQLTMMEQELVQSKGDFKLLTEKMDEMREAESSKREAMEYRISTLQNDHEVWRRYHEAELENLQNELHQATMERDRLFQSLKDSERGKESLLRAKSGRDSMGDDDEDVQAELTKLRLEKAQLLTLAAEEGARVERRLREARGAEKSSAEADIILERELRVAAEKALENAKLETNELRMELESRGSGSRMDTAPSKERLHRELEALKAQIESLSIENDGLRQQLDTVKRQAREQIAHLTDECRQAKTRAAQLEREGRLEAEIQAEVARLRARANGMDPYRMVADNPADESEEIPVAQLYDLIQKQKQSIEEERAVYSELLLEHDELLALLAQHDVYRSALNAALERVGGPEAVQEAVREAERVAVARFGKFVNLHEMEQHS